MNPSCIFHIASRQAARSAGEDGEYRHASLTTEGFIHFSSAHQVLGVAERYYAGQTDLVLLVVDPGLLKAELRFEGDEAFPHLYGPLNADAIIDTVDLASFDGSPVHPDTQAMLRHYRFSRLPVEGTLYRSCWRSTLASCHAGTPAGTAMIGLYADSPRSASSFHRLAYDEIWHFYGGDPLSLRLLHADGSSSELRMGADPCAGQLVQAVVPAGTWQAGELVPGGRYALFGCTMAPGFTGACFEAGSPEELAALYPDEAQAIRRLSVKDGRRRMPEGFSA